EKAAQVTTGGLDHEPTPVDDAAPGATPVAAPDEDPASDATPTVAVAEDSAPAFADNGITVEVLERELGIDPAVSTPALAAPTLSALEELLEHAAPWERDALLGLAVDFTIDAVRRELGLAGAAADDSRADAEAILRAVTTPA